MGRTHGETVEQEWAYINLAALSTREMGPGARHSALDDSWGGWNWKKLLGFGKAISCFPMPPLTLFVSDRFAAQRQPRQGNGNGIHTAKGSQRLYIDLPTRHNPGVEAHGSRVGSGSLTPEPICLKRPRYGLYFMTII